VDSIGPVDRGAAVAGLRRVGYCALAAVALALLVGLFLSASPIRWDRKAFRNYLTQPPIPAATTLVLVTRNADWKGGHAHQYTTNLVSYPPPRQVEWLIFSETYEPGDWRPTGLLTPEGAVRNVDGTPHAQLSADSVWITLDDTTAVEVRRRSNASVLVLSFSRGSFFEPPAWRMSLFSLLKCTLFFWGLALLALPLSRWIPVWSILPILACLHIWLASLFGLLTNAAIPLTIATTIVSGIVLQFMASGNSGVRRMELAWKALALSGILVLFLVVAVTRLDFDGDMLTHWLPMARTIHFTGGHDLTLLQQFFGGGHRVAYPPGIPMYLATMFWIAGVNEQTIAFGDALHGSVGIYRAGTVVLQLSVLLGGFAAAILIRRAAIRIALLLALSATAIVLIGKPAAGEVLLVPLAATALMLMSNGERSTRLAGVFIAGSLFLLKSDAVLIVPFLLFPWYLMQARAHIRDLFLFLGTLVPALLFRWQLNREEVNSDFAFVEMNVSSLAQGLPRLGEIAGEAASLITRSLHGPAIVLAVALLFAAIASRRWRNTVIPAVVISFYAGAAVIYMFSVLDVGWHVATSYGRITASAGVAILICAIQRAASPTSDHLGTSPAPPHSTFLSLW
jgi:hypothetical protein